MKTQTHSGAEDALVKVIATLAGDHLKIALAVMVVLAVASVWAALRVKTPLLSLLFMVAGMALLLYAGYVAFNLGFVWWTVAIAAITLGALVYVARKAIRW